MSFPRTLTTCLILLALVVSLPGWLCAGCEACTSKPAPAVSGCHESDCASSAMTTRADCCGHAETATPPSVPRAAATPVSPAVPAALPALPVRPMDLRAAAFHTPEEPPALHEGVGLYTLHAAFLI
ncbi:MAG TPA: hypothetical protein VLT87_08085 [Thermoanaerobaculia bacterium]|nr:hypothetical protein [Thermoanaerobaculia bacterium]